MKLIRTVLCLGMLLFLYGNNYAQESPTKIGFGIGFGQQFVIGEGPDLFAMVLPFDFTNFSVVFRGENFRIEPTFGYFSTSTSSDIYESTYSNLRLGAVVAFANSKGSLNYYYGIDLGIYLSSQSRESKSEYSPEPTDESKTDFFIGPTIGGEYMFSDNFSLGGEIQINYISLGNYNDESTASQSAVSTRAIIMLRWYLQ